VRSRLDGPITSLGRMWMAIPWRRGSVPGQEFPRPKEFYCRWPRNWQSKSARPQAYAQLSQKDVDSIFNPQAGLFAGTQNALTINQRKVR